MIFERDLLLWVEVGIKFDGVECYRGATEMLSASSQVVIGTLLHSVKFDDLNAELIDRMARALIEEPLVGLTPADEHQAIVDALRSSATLTEVIRLPASIPEPHGEKDFRDFLRRLLERLDIIRPWPVPLHRELNADRWSRYENAQVVGPIKMRYVDAQERINYAFGGVEANGSKLALRSQAW